MTPEESIIDKIRTRPRFKLYTNAVPETFESQMKDYLNAHRDEYTGSVNRECTTIFVKSEEDTYWKPNLTLRAEREDEKTVIRGIFGPSSSVWTFFMFLYFVFGILWMVFITLWFVGRQINSNEYGWALYASFGALFMVLNTYLAALYGQKKAKPEMEKLRGFALESVKKLPD